MPWKSKAQKQQHANHAPYKRTAPTPLVGDIVAKKCLNRNPPCPFMRLLCKLPMEGKPRPDYDPGRVTCPYYASGYRPWYGVAILSTPYCFFYDGHLRISFLRDRVKKRLGIFLDFLASLMFSIWIGAVAWGMFQMAKEHIINNAKGWGLGIPIGPFMAAFFASAALFFFVLIIETVLSLIKLIKFKNK